MACLNNLKQIALACHNYHDTHGHFPVGTHVESASPPEDRLSWLVAILPFLEHETLYQRFDSKQPWSSPHNQPWSTKVVKIYRCPSDHRTEPAYANATVYVGVAGAGNDAATLPLKAPRAGVFGYERKTRIEDVTDGTSNTLLVIETAVANGPWAAGGPATVRGIDPQDCPPVRKDGPFGLIHSASEWNFGRISVEASAVAADGTVRHIRRTMNADVLAALATISGKEPLPADW